MEGVPTATAVVAEARAAVWERGADEAVWVAVREALGAAVALAKEAALPMRGNRRRSGSWRIGPFHRR